MKNPISVMEKQNRKTKKPHHAAIVLAAGTGSRMQSDVPKQFLLLEDKPVLYYALRAFEESFVDEIILVTGEDWLTYCRADIVEAYGFTKVTRIIAGGAERYDSVYRGLCALKDCDYVYIHDGARPFVDERILDRAKQSVMQYAACAAAMPVKDTIKSVDDDRFVTATPDRKTLWQMQTPQAFSYGLIREAYDKLFVDRGNEISGQVTPAKPITDDAMVVEGYGAHPVKLFYGSYRNIKITTPEDLLIAKAFLLAKQDTENAASPAI